MSVKAKSVVVASETMEVQLMELESAATRVDVVRAPAARSFDCCTTVSASNDASFKAYLKLSASVDNR